MNNYPCTRRFPSARMARGWILSRMRDGKAACAWGGEEIFLEGFFLSPQEGEGPACPVLRSTISPGRLETVIL